GGGTRQLPLLVPQARAVFASCRAGRGRRPAAWRRRGRAALTVGRESRARPLAPPRAPLHLSPMPLTIGDIEAAVALAPLGERSDFDLNPEVKAQQLGLHEQ